MGKKSRLNFIKNDIEEFFDGLPKKVFTLSELAGIMSTQKEEWELPKTQTLSAFTNFLLANTKLKIVHLHSENYSSVERYVWESPSIYAVGESIKKKAYLSHGSAVFLHGLTDLIPKTVYVNYEQSPKPQRGVLVQENIHRAFAGKQRQSNLVYEYDDYKITMINGKFTNRLEVSELLTPSLEILDVTKIERTLIDITVRPAYGGGVFEVLEVYKKAMNSVSISTLIATLKKLNYLYPYHQVVGFYMQRAGYSEKQWSRLLKLGTNFDFYITYGLSKDKKFDQTWRLFYPKGL